MASRARHFTCRAAAALQTCMEVNGLRCSHEDENTRIVCMSSLAEQRSAQTERCHSSMEDCSCRALQRYR